MSVTPQDFDFIRKLVRERSAIVLEPGREYLVESRLMPLSRAHGLPGLTELVQKLKGPSANLLVNEVVEAMTTNETSFFRDPTCFEGFQQTILPEMIEKRAATRTLTIWSGASSSGQEAYTLAMSLKEAGSRLAGWNVKLVATDLCESMLTRCNEGVYSQLEVNRGLPTPMLLRYFTKKGTSWQVKPDLRSMIDFKILNLVSTWPHLPPVDIIFLRNVMIYFDLPTKKQILRRIRKLLRPDGYLVLGSTETTTNVDSEFERKAVGRAVFYGTRATVGSMA